MNVVDDKFFTCFVCGKRVAMANWQKRLKNGSFKRFKIHGYFKTFHDKCFKEYKKYNPNWFKG